MFAHGDEKTGLGRRIALLLVQAMGRRMLTLAALVLPALALWIFGGDFISATTHYTTGPSPVCYGSGYLPAKVYWILGGIFGVVFIAAFPLVGLPWMAIIR